ncbi:hypothetical protein [Streptomyces erythrochromogenes]|uniref:hypothetical protein n=1 Tax=Streptomyces erythrochromogenes TaxID=285574 RepID=UPI00386D8376|nr:hypothetical protein OG364_01815 [Streptomyces erythrochromogenes]
MFAARALAAIVLTAGTVTPIACAPSAHVATPPATANRVAVAGTSAGNPSLATHNAWARAVALGARAGQGTGRCGADCGCRSQA